MSRENGNNRQMRERIAQLAARLMAVDGIDDFALAKRKAARQAGAPDTRNLPNNEEVEQALRAYQQLYQADEQQARLRRLRQNAREMMQLLAQFDPHLSGSVLSGSAGKYSDINIHLFTDSVKDVEMFLLNRQIPYRSRERRVYIGGEQRSVPNFTVSTDDADFDITVFAPRDLRYQLRTTAEGKPFDRARIDWLNSVLESARTAGAATNLL
ncbi:MAG TPA: UDP-N-acetylmuramate--alanine ligase [Burkholderiales bacterium]|nr:UDP-N-acetylmuramate--alanine ligase [Burkholderiales bacterium]